VKLEEVFETSKKLYMVLELLTGGELFDRVVKKSKFSEKEAALVIRDIASALKYLHSLGIVHRDLKVISIACFVVSRIVLSLS
jgi:serine/threonine protein kinase